jgi:HPt (histidine-containing phosphotransfer) domain-containing protein
MDDAELAKEVVRLFLKDAAAFMAELDVAAAAADAQNARLYAHSLKGLSYNVGAKLLGSLAERMEAAAKEGRMDEVVALMPSLAPAFEDLKKALALESWLSDLDFS